MFTIIRYDDSRAAEWDDFVEHAKNSTFLFCRSYMDYHRDRFSDCSLMVYDDKGLLAVLPANVQGDTLCSHGGLTYGGLLMSRRVRAEMCVKMFGSINGFLGSECGVSRVVYKPTPWIYHDIPAEEDLYAIVAGCKAQLVAREISSAIRLDDRIAFTQLRRRCAAKARRNGVTVRETGDIDAFWQILDDNLEHKYATRPVHTAAELHLLKSRFPDRIRLFMAYAGNRPLGGTMVFECRNVVHTQYISASAEGKAVGALDLLFAWLIGERYADRRFFDFGKSTENQGRWLNSNLIFQKEGFGGRGVCYDTYEWKI